MKTYFFREQLYCHNSYHIHLHLKFFCEMRILWQYKLCFYIEIHTSLFPSFEFDYNSLVLFHITDVRRVVWSLLSFLLYTLFTNSITLLSLSFISFNSNQYPTIWYYDFKKCWSQELILRYEPPNRHYKEL
jgi:hypothetical protein